MRNEYDLGIMQGRLLPKYKHRYQAHPVGYWQAEFPIASHLGLRSIEFILDFTDACCNPLLNPDGIEEIQSLMRENNVAVKSVCADYFMIAPFHSPDRVQLKESQRVLSQLVQNCAILGVSEIVIPCVDQSSLLPEGARDRFFAGLLPTLDNAKKYDVRLALETDLCPETFAELLYKFPDDVVTVNYDTGNSAALGYCVDYEFECYGDRITDIHIKD